MKKKKTKVATTTKQNLKKIDEVMEHLKNSDSSEAHAIHEYIEGGLEDLEGKEKVDMFNSMLSEFEEWVGCAQRNVAK